MTAILNGIKVIECTQWVAGPRAGALLAYLGANVIHVEPRGGEPKRGLQRIMGESVITSRGLSASFEYCNRGKKSITLDLAKPEGRDVFRRMIEGADVFMTNFRTQAINKLKLDYDTLSKWNPKLVYSSSTSFGTKGPDAAVGAFDGMGQARSGWMWINRDIGDGRPNVVGGSMADQLTGMMQAFGIVSALLAREKFGFGQEVSNSMLAAAIYFLEQDINQASFLGTEFKRELGKEAHNPLYNSYQCKDGRWLILGIMALDAWWSRFCRATGMPELENDSRFNSQARREENRVLLVSIIEKQFATKTLAEWSKICKKNDFNFAPCQRPGEVLEDPQALANECIVEAEHPVHGKVRLVGHPLHFSKTPGVLHASAPECGQHTEEVLLELGYSWDEIADLRRREVI